MKKNLDITAKPRYREQILPVPWPFVISRFHCIFMCQTSCLRLRGVWGWRGGICATTHVMVDFKPNEDMGMIAYSGSNTGDKKYTTFPLTFLWPNQYALICWKSVKSSLITTSTTNYRGGCWGLTLTLKITWTGKTVRDLKLNRIQTIITEDLQNVYSSFLKTFKSGAGSSESFEVDGLVVKVSGHSRNILFKKHHP